jgi:succinate dehydrogenase / fumarate reductase flavoprotein subunit
MIRTLQDHGIHQGIDVHMECTSPTLLKTATRRGAFGYDRERGRFKLFRAKAVVLATGGIGRAYKITSNSWEYTGDGHALAYDAGAELIDMEFVQFHPTGMVWPPSVRGILVTEGVRGEGGVLQEQRRRRFMFDDIPDNYKQPQTADNEEEGWRYTQGDKNARRPPELLTRDHVARCINCARSRPAAAARTAASSSTSPGSRRSSRTRRSTSSASCRACTTSSRSWPTSTSPRSRWRSARRRTTSWAASGSTPTRRCRRCRAVRRRRVRRGHQRREPARRQLAVRPARVRQARRRVRARSSRGANGAPRRRRARWTTRRARRWRRSSAARGEGPYTGPARPAGHDAGPRRHRPHEDEMQRALDELEALQGARRARRRRRHREYNPGWHTALDLRNLLTVSEAIARSALERKESRGGHFRDDYPGQGPRVRHVQHRRPQGPRRRMEVRASRCRRCRRAEADHRGDEVT